MKTWRILGAMALALSVVVLAGPVAAEQGAAAKRVKVTRLEGKAFSATEAKGPWRTAKVGDWIIQGRFVRTGEKSRAELQLPDGGVIRLAPGTSIQLTQLYFPEKSAKKEFNARLVAGRFWARVRKLAGADSYFQVQTSTAVAGVRGTAFQVNFDDAESSSLFKVYEGKVAVQGKPMKPIYQTEGPRREVSGPKEVPGPREVSREEWERIVSSWQVLSVGPDGRPSEAEKIDPAKDLAEDEFTAWNLKLDEIDIPAGEEQGAPPMEQPTPAPEEGAPEEGASEEGAPEAPGQEAQ